MTEGKLLERKKVQNATQELHYGKTGGFGQKGGGGPGDTQPERTKS